MLRPRQHSTFSILLVTLSSGASLPQCQSTSPSGEPVVQERVLLTAATLPNTDTDTRLTLNWLRASTRCSPVTPSETAQCSVVWTDRMPSPSPVAVPTAFMLGPMAAPTTPPSKSRKSTQPRRLACRCLQTPMVSQLGWSATTVTPMWT